METEELQYSTYNIMTLQLSTYCSLKKISG